MNAPSNPRDGTVAAGFRDQGAGALLAGPEPSGSVPLGAALPAGLPRRVHLLGIGGAGVSGAARLLAARGHRLSGHDLAASPLAQGLAELGVALQFGASQAEGLPADAELVVRSAAVPLDDPQVVAALARGVTVLKYAELLGRLAPSGRTLAVAGTHGKTTTSWMLYRALAALASRGEEVPLYDERARRGLRAGALVGGLERELGTNAVPPGIDGWFALEACEYDRSFLSLSPFAAAITNVDADHLDCFGDLAGVERAFAEFAARIDPAGLLVLGRDVPAMVEASARCRVWRVGRELLVDDQGLVNGRAVFSLVGPPGLNVAPGSPGWRVERVELSVPGRFNGDNAAVALGLALGAAGDGSSGEAMAAAQAVSRYPGAARRFEPWGEVHGVRLVHDYAHHPTEVRATLEAARATAPGSPLAVLFQPHQGTRTARFLEEFAAALSLADQVVVADVYGARRAAAGELLAGAPELVAALERLGTRAVYGGNLQTAARLFAETVPVGALALVIGAGDIDRIQEQLCDHLALRSRPEGASRR